MGGLFVIAFIVVYYFIIAESGVWDDSSPNFGNHYPHEYEEKETHFVCKKCGSIKWKTENGKML